MLEELPFFFGKIIQWFWKGPLYRKRQAGIAYYWIALVVEVYDQIFLSYP
jgi:hypothetical protein